MAPSKISSSQGPIEKKRIFGPISRFHKGFSNYCIVGNANLNHVAMQAEALVCARKKQSDERVRYCSQTAATFLTPTHLAVIAQAAMILRY